MALIEAVDLTKIYSKGPHQVAAVKGVSLSLEKGEVLCILGRSGSGKTSLLNLLGLLDVPTKGQILLEGRGMADISSTEKARLRRCHFGFVFQQFNLIFHLSAEENVALPLKYDGIVYRERMRRAREMLHMVGLEQRRGFTPDELSGGEAQRLAIARALINRPQLILADEPTSELDTETSGEILELLMRLRQEHGTTLIIVSHDPHVATYAQRTLSMKDGELSRIEGQRCTV
jgi:ABC-type lipoprotein export system ATPase subunit